MYISDIEINAKRASKACFVYLLVAIFCALFGAIYELYSHGVYSFYMIYAFAFPLTAGTLPFLIMNLKKVKKYPGILSLNLYHSGIATLTVGSIVRGILDIYGTTNTLTEYYWLVGFLFVFVGILVYAMSIILGRQNESEDRLSP